MLNVTKQPPLNFTSEKQRQLWFAENAEYFTVIRRRAGKNERHELPTIKAALGWAKLLLIDDPSARLMIYAVWGASDHYIATVCSR